MDMVLALSGAALVACGMVLGWLKGWNTRKELERYNRDLHDDLNRMRVNYITVKNKLDNLISRDSRGRFTGHGRTKG